MKFGKKNRRVLWIEKRASLGYVGRTMVGTRLGAYILHERINSGGMADIYYATDDAGRAFAIRVLLPQYRFHFKRIRQFRWGCTVLTHFDHDNIVKIYDIGKIRGHRFAVMEFVDGPNLKELMLRGDEGIAQHQLQLLIGMASALAHVHERGFIHFDFKPENVLVPKTYAPKLVDFDLAVPRPSRPKKFSSLAGTPAYLAPEQLAGQPLDERVDIFAFGITAYEVLTGKKPVTGISHAEVLQKYAHFDQFLKPPRAHNPNIPLALERIVVKCLQKDPEKRYPTMALALRDLQQV
jgi:serine/threonine protein kinase